MSRIDEALSRARTPGPLTPPTPPSADGTATFAAEAGNSTKSPDAADESADALSGVIEVEGDLTRLPNAERLTVGAHDETSVEQYRRLAARLLLAQAESGTRLVMVTSALPGEGKTLTSANLALTLSESYKRPVLLIDGDLRRPWVHELFQVPNVSGLNDGLRLESNRRIPLLSYTDNLTLLTAGRPDSDPMSVLSGERMKRVLAEAAKRFDFVIIDTPPVALLPDAHLLSSLVDAVLLVVDAGASPLPALKKAVDAVGRARVLGVVLNRANNGISHGYNYYGAYQHYGLPHKAQS
jgi:capsular exopolysaccharide synthesis family protein